MKFTAEDIATLIDGEVKGDNSAEISSFSGIEEAKPDDLTFIDSEKYSHYLELTNAGIILVPKSLSIPSEEKVNSTLIKCANPRMALAQLLTKYKELTSTENGISENLAVGENSIYNSCAYIGNFVSIGNDVNIGMNTKIHSHVSIHNGVTIGENCLIHSGVQILGDCILGDHVTIQANAIIGSDGFGFVPNSENNYMKIPHIGNVVIEDHVEIGAGTCIDRATMGSTIIRKGVKLDNLIQIAHNVEIGENTVIAAQTGIAGSTKIGKNCLIGGQVGIIGHITIADEVKIAAQSGIGQSIKQVGEIHQGSPSLKIRDYKMSYVGFKNLPSLMKRIDKIEKSINHES